MPSVPAAEIQGGILLDGSYSIHSWKTDAEGLLTLPNASDHPYTFAVRVDGFEPARREKVVLRPDASVVWHLRRAHVLTGTVTSPDGRPVAGATIRQLAELEGETVRSLEPDNGPVLGKTDGQGRFRLTTLARDRTYVLLIEAGDLGRHVVSDVHPIAKPQAIELGPKLAVRGKVVGDLAGLPQKDGRPTISYTPSVTVGNHTRVFTPETMPLRVEDGVGYFAIDGLLPGSVRITAGEVSLPVNVAKPVEGLVIGLAPAAPKRHVIVQFSVDGGSPVVKGSVVVGSVDPSPLARSINETLTINNGRVEIDAYVNGSFYLRPSRVLGCWFEEQNIQHVPAGDAPLVIRVPTIPAGAIVGRVLDADGRPAVRAKIRVTTVSPPPPWKGRLKSLDVPSEVSPLDGSFMLSPLPLGGSYLVMAYRTMGQNILIQEPVPLDAANPIRTLELRLPPGKPARVKVVGPDGTPLPGVEVSLKFQHPQAAMDFSSDQVTDPQGQLLFENLNPQAGEYAAFVGSHRNFQPAAATPLVPGGAPAVIRLTRGHVHPRPAVDAATPKPPAGLEAGAQDGKAKADEGDPDKPLCCFTGKVKWIKPEGEWEGEAVPIGRQADMHWLVGLDVLSIEKSGRAFEKTGERVLVIHSPAKFFPQPVEEVIGKQFSFKLFGDTKGDGPYTHAEVIEKQTIEFIPKESSEEEVKESSEKKQS